MQPSAQEFVPPPEHKLNSSWSFYFDKKIARGQGTAEDYQRNVKLYGKFDTVEGFWRLYSWFKDPKNMQPAHDIFMIRGDSAPAWESFPNGGSWILKVHHGNENASRVWEELLFACIGEWFGSGEVCGAVLSTRPKYHNISLWMSHINPRLQTTLGERLRTTLNLDASSTLEYKPFQQSLADGSSYRNTELYSFQEKH
jgi:translation initiation factor 4E